MTSKNTNKYYVYKYVDTLGNVVYVGITNNLKRRVNEHKIDKLQVYDDVRIDYFPVNTRGDAEMLETYLINYYKTSKYSNVAKTKKGDFTFLDRCNELPWTTFTGKVDNTLKSFVISDLIENQPIIKQQSEIMFRLDDKSIDGIVNRYNLEKDNLRKDVDREITSEERAISEIREVRNDPNNTEKISLCDVGITLHMVRWKVLLGMLYNLNEYPLPDFKYLQKLSILSGEALKNTELYEKCLRGEIHSQDKWDEVIKNFKKINNDNTYKDMIDKMCENNHYQERMIVMINVNDNVPVSEAT